MLSAVSACLLSLSLLAFNSQAVLLRGRDIDRPLLDSYDYIVVGCGISGLVVTNRLSEDPTRTVLCIEAGQADDYEDIIQIPVYVGSNVGGVYDWRLGTVPQTQLDGKTRPIPQGKVLGGGSILNAMCWNRGGADDYDAWEALGNPGWGWDGMLPYFRKSETYTPVFSEEAADEYSINYSPSAHGFDGPVQVSYPKYIYPQSANLFQAMNDLGLPTQFDPNDGQSAGPAFVPTDLDPNNQTRSDARRTYFDPYVTRDNLHVITGQHVTRLLIEGVANNSQVSNPTPGGNEDGNGPTSGNSDGFGFGPGGSTQPIAGDPPNKARRQVPASQDLRIQGVEFAPSADAPRQIIYATREVIVAAGALHSAQLLQLSGIGPESLLRQFEIPIAIDLPGVGNNLQDHCLVGTFYPYNNASYPSPTQLTTNATYNAEAEEEYRNFKTGPWTAGSPNALAFNPLSLITNNAGVIIANASRQRPTDFLPPDTDPTVVAGFTAQKRLLVSRMGRDNVAAYEIINNNAGSLTVAVMHPFSRGTCYIASADPFEPPRIDPRWLSNPVDRQVLVEALFFNRRILAQPSMQELRPAQFVPPIEANEAAINQVINGGIRTEFHPSGTLAMLPLEQGGVVDSHLRVYGTRNLRVVDAGIYPLIPAAHLQAVVYGVAEKAADIIKADNLPVSSIPQSSTAPVSVAISVASSAVATSATFSAAATPITSEPYRSTSTVITSLSSSTTSAQLSPESVLQSSATNISLASFVAATTRVAQSPTTPVVRKAQVQTISAGVSITGDSVSAPQTQAAQAPSQPDPLQSVFVVTTTLPADLPAQLSTMQLGQSVLTGSDAATTLNDATAAAISSVASVIVGSPPESGATAMSSGTDIEQVKHEAAINAVIKWLSSFFRLD